MSRQRQSRSQRPGAVRVGGVVFDRRELLDLAAAWLALALAFTFFIGLSGSLDGLTPLGALAPTFLLSLIAVGTGFLLHELAHKVLAVRFGQVAGFRASYPMLGLAVASGLAGFLFAAPGAVYHRGRVTAREHGLIAVAGPVTNLGLTVAFAPLVLVPGLVGNIGRWGVLVNVFLAAFNMLPAGPLDGKTVRSWDRQVFWLVLGTAAVLAGLAAVWLLV